MLKPYQHIYVFFLTEGKKIKEEMLLITDKTTMEKLE